MTTDNFINSLENAKGQLSVDRAESDLDMLTEQEKISRSFYQNMVTSIQDGLDIVKRDQLYKSQMKVMNYANQIRDELNYGDLDLTNSAIYTAYIEDITNKFAEFKAGLGVFATEESNKFLNSSMQNVLRDLKEVTSKQLHKQRLDLAVGYLNFDNHRHDDYENVLDSTMGQEAYHTLVSQWGELRTHQFLNEQRNKNIEQMTTDPNISMGLFEKYLVDKMGLPYAAAKPYIDRKTKVEIQASSIMTLNINEINKNNPRAATLISEFNSMLDNSPLSGIENVKNVMIAKIFEDKTLSTTDKMIRSNIIATYSEVAKEKLQSNPIDYFIERELASPAGFLSSFPENKAASRLDLVEQTVMYNPGTPVVQSPNPTNKEGVIDLEALNKSKTATLFTNQELLRLRNGDITMLPFLQSLKREIKLSQSPYAKLYQNSFENVLLEKSSPVIFASLYGLNSQMDLDRLSSSMIKNPSITPANVLDKVVEQDSTWWFTDKRKHNLLYKNDKAFKLLMQNEFAKLFVDGKPPESFNLKEMAAKANISVKSDKLWSLGNNIDSKYIEDVLISSTYLKPKGNSLEGIIEKY
ncbi:MAG: hypothetical protein ACRCST_11645, partial [Turicibacter sp.]